MALSLSFCVVCERQTSFSSVLAGKHRFVNLLSTLQPTSKQALGGSCFFSSLCPPGTTANVISMVCPDFFLLIIDGENELGCTLRSPTDF